MKKLTVILFILVAFTLSAIEFDLSVALRTPKLDSTAIDYEFSIRSHLDSLLSVEIEFERQDGEYYRNLELFFWQYYKFLQFSGKYINIQEDDLKVCSVDLRYKYGAHSIGVAEVWNMHPTINLVAGEDIRKKIGIPYLLPVDIIIITDFYTNDFRKFNNQTEVTFSAAISSIISVYLRHKERYFDKWNWSIKLGIKVRI